MNTFLVGLLASLVPSMVLVAWLVWRADFFANDPERDQDLA
jgi:hypothetical protein